MPSFKMVDVLKKIKYNTTLRTRGLRTTSRIFGYMPRETIRKDFCSSTSLAREYPQEHKTICDFASLLSKFYKNHCPDMYDYHEKVVKDKIKDEWIIDQSPFTSGIINKNNPLKYHLDAGNIKHVFSNMVCFKKDCTGGHLSIPEFNIGLEIADKTMLFFDGQSIMHGVTPFNLKSIQAYRFTIVYYTLHQMWKCEPIDKEIARIKTVKTNRETLRYKRLANIQLTQEEQKRALYVKQRPGIV